DDRVVSIKITIYRLANNSRLVDALCRAAEAGKEVLVLMELRARFDEQSNLDYSRELYDAGCDIIYGMGGYKVHSKVTLLTLKNGNSWSYITQIGTGNYNESTAMGYSDLSLMTADPEIGNDANNFFRNLQLGNLFGSYKHLLQSPSTVKPTLLDLMEKEKEKGPEGFCFFKMNSFTDRDFIDKVADVSRAGGRVQMIIRGINCLLPGIPGKTENVECHSIVGRFLEHARIYIFDKEDPKIYIGSADLMTRNTEHRVEILCPVYDPQIKKEILDFMNRQFQDNKKGRIFGPDGDLHPIEDGKDPFIVQNHFMEESSKSLVKLPLDEKKRPSLWTRIKSFFS
uniref:phospholipase D-like domain-containing protein n=1 Tax=Kallipyga massiliensis TaxID=1472764 RepID=UPI0026F02509